MSHRQSSWGALVRLSALSFVVLASALGAIWLTWQTRPAPPEPAMPSPGYAEVGVNVALEQYAPETLNAVLDRLQAAGVHWLRQRFPWDQIEPAPERFDWTTWDRIIDATSDRGMHLIAVLDSSPEWARRPEDADNPLAPPRERADFGRFVEAFVARYGDRLDVYQIWDEPNIAPHWGARPIDPADYLGLLREGFYQVRSGDPHALVLLAALAPNDEPGGTNLSDLAFLDRIYALGGRRWFDIVAAEPYGFNEPPESQAGLGRAAALRAIMERHGDARTPVWAVAFGWNALPKGWSGRPSLWGQVDEATQASYLKGAVERARREWPWMGPMLWAVLQPAVPTDDPHWGFALWTADGASRPAWDALVQMTAPPTIVGLGTHRPDHPALRYEGKWRVTPLAADIGQTGDRLVIPFWGRGLALQIRRGPYWAYLTISIDGRPAPALPRDAKGDSYLVLYGPEPRSDVVDLAKGLPLGEHNAIIEATGGWGQWALERIIVRRDAPPARARLRHVLAVLALLSGGGVLWSLRRGDGPRALSALTALSNALDGLINRLPDGAHMALALILGTLTVLAPMEIVRLAAFLALASVIWFRLDLLPPLVMLYLPFYLRPLSLAGRAFQAPELAVLVGTAVLAGRWLLAWAMGRRPWKARPGPFDALIAAFVLVAMVATATAQRRDVALHELRVVMIEPALFYMILTQGPEAVGRRFSPWRVVDAFAIGAVLAGLIGIAQYVTGAGVIAAEGVRRVRALYGSPNNLALYLDRAIPVMLSVAVFGRGRRRWLYGGAALASLAACFLTFSKGAWLLGLPAAVVVLALIGIWMARGTETAWRRPVLITLAILLLMGVVLVPFLHTERFTRLLDFRHGTGFFRLRLWQSAWRMALDHPWLGVGPDNFLYQYRSHYVLPDAWAELNLSHPHDVFLDLWTRLGLLGLSVGVALFVQAALTALRLLGDREIDIRVLAAGLLASLAATVAHGLIDNSIFLIDLGFVWMMTLGLLAGLWRERAEILPS
ncbi:MAG: O-antigen ligase family protein [Anaerolineae bacterium]|nr:O-antigen ligase family protein [Anaerolineae bacterium]